MIYAVLVIRNIASTTVTSARRPASLASSGSLAISMRAEGIYLYIPSADKEIAVLW